MFYIDIAKVDQDVTKIDRNVAYVAMAIHICIKCIFQMFDLFQTMLQK